MSGDDLTPYLTPPAEPGPSQNVRYRQGTIITFNQATLENVVKVGGTMCANLPLLGVADASALVPGAVVGLLVIESTVGLTTYAILGRLVTPATAAATEAISLLSSWVVAKQIQTQQPYSLTAFGDLATIGPIVVATIRATGRALVMMTSQMQWIDTDADIDGAGGAVSMTLAGANTMTVAAASAFLKPNSFIGSSTTSQLTLQGTWTGIAVLEGLNPGPTTFTMKYQSQVAGETVDFGRRSLVVITL